MIVDGSLCRFREEFREVGNVRLSQVPQHSRLCPFPFNFATKALSSAFNIIVQLRSSIRSFCLSFVVLQYDRNERKNYSKQVKRKSKPTEHETEAPIVIGFHDKMKLLSINGQPSHHRYTCK